MTQQFIELAFAYPLELSMMPTENYFLLPLRVAESMGLEPTVFSLRSRLLQSLTSKKEMVDGVRVQRFGGSAQLLLALKSSAPSLVHGHSYGWLPATTSPFVANKYVFTAHSADFGRYPYMVRKILTHLVARSTIIIALSETEASEFRPYAGNRVRVIPHPIDLNFFRSADSTVESELRENYGDSPLIFTIGNLTPVKNLEILLYAFERVHRKWTSARLVIAGGSPKVIGGIGSSRHYDGDYFNSLLNLRSSLRLTDSVSFVGHIPPQLLRAYLRTASAYVHTSLREAQSLSTGEAAAAGAPLVLSDIPVFREYYTDAALFFDRRSVTELERRLLQVLSEPESTIALRRKAQECVDRFNPSSIFERMRRVYEECLT